jgi:Tol biopolymer transport system component
MPDVREVYDMVTGQKPAAPGALERQRRRQIRAARSKKLGVFAVTAVIAVVAVVLVVELRGGENTTTPANGSTAPPLVGTRPFFLDLRTGDASPVPDALVPGGIAAGMFENYSASPDGTRLVYGTCLTFSCAGGRSEVMVVGNLDGTDVRTVPVPTGLNGYLPRWSPDGAQLVYQQRDGAGTEVGNVFLYDVASGRRTQLTDLRAGHDDWWFLSARFGPDGRSVIFHRPSPNGSTWNVWSVPVTGGTPAIVLRDAAFPEFFPDGNRMAFVQPFVSSPGGRLEIAEGDGSRRTLVEANSPDGIWWPAISPDGTRIAYRDGNAIYVVSVSTGESSAVANGDNAEWLDDDTLIISP